MLADTQQLESDVRLSSQRDPRINRPDLIAASADEIGQLVLRRGSDRPCPQ